MWFWEKTKSDETLPGKLGYSRYYEHDGALRAYANRAMVLAFCSAGAAILALAFAAYVRIQPPTVIRIDTNGDASIVGSDKANVRVSQTAPEAEPTEVERRAFVHRFLERYLDFSPF